MSLDRIKHFFSSLGTHNVPSGVAALAATAVARPRVVATVEAIDHEARTATLKGPVRAVKIKADQRAKNVNQIKAGDRVYVEFTRALAVAGTK